MENKKENKKHIAILFPSSQSGGVYQYALSIAEALAGYYKDNKYSFIYYKGEDRPIIFSSFDAEYIEIEDKFYSMTRKIIHFIGLALRAKFLLIKDFSEKLKKHNIDLLIVPTPFSYNIPLDIPFVASIPDYMHKYYPQFSEYTFFHKLSREIVYTYYAKKALLIVADSYHQIGDLEKFAGIKKDKIRVIYYIPPNYIYKYRDMSDEEIKKILEKYNLPKRFVFFPAQFWAQKNHKRLIKAIHLIKEKYNEKINLVLVGNASGFYEKTYKEVMFLIKRLGLKNQVIHLGYVSNKEMVALYKRSVALVAPPFQGPTTIPPLEAMLLGTPVLTINLFELPKIVGEAGLLFDPESVKDVAEKIYKIWTNESLRQELIKRGGEKIKNFTPESYADKWRQVIEEAIKISSK